MTRSFWKTSESKESATLTRQVHLLIRDGKSEDVETDELRERAAKLWRHLSVEEQKRIRRLSAELAMLYDSEVPRPRRKLTRELERLNRDRRRDRNSNSEQRKAKLRSQMFQSYERNDWESILEMFRNHPSLFDPWMVASFRGRAYHNLGDYETALAFYEFAHDRKPSFPGNTTILMQLLADMGRLSEAMRMAEVAIEDPNSHPAVLVIAAITLLRPTDPGSPAWSHALRRVVDICEAALKKPPEFSDPMTQSMVYSTQADAFRELGESDNALVCYRNALSKHPQNAAALRGIGILLYQSDPDRAADYLLKSIRVPGPRITTAYFYLAPYFLRQGKPELTVNVADEGIKYSENDHERALLRTWRAIGILRTTGDVEVARADFVEAMRMGSDIPNVVANYRVFREVEERIRSESLEVPTSEGEPTAWQLADDLNRLLPKSSRAREIFSTADRGLETSRQFAGAM